jgi:threonine dehydratase
MACRTPVPAALDVIGRHVARVVRVTDDEVRAAMRAFFTDTHNVAEGAGAAGLAALMQERDRRQGRKVGVVLCGGNVDASVFREVLAA